MTCLSQRHDLRQLKYIVIEKIKKNQNVIQSELGFMLRDMQAFDARSNQ
jgi:hypothetical protein